MISLEVEDFLTLIMVYARIQMANELGQVWQYNENKLNRKQLVSKQKSYLCIKEMNEKVRESIDILSKKRQELGKKLELPEWVVFLGKIFK